MTPAEHAALVGRWPPLDPGIVYDAAKIGTPATSPAWKSAEKLAAGVYGSSSRDGALAMAAQTLAREPGARVVRVRRIRKAVR